MEEIEDMLVEILRTYNEKYPSDITDQVFLAIERDPEKYSRYNFFADGDYGTTNSLIGRFVEDFTKLQSTGRIGTPKSNLIKSYSILG
jgi:hypothetical protein